MLNRGFWLLLIILVTPVNAEAPFYHKKAEGWFWYEAIPIPHPVKPLADPNNLTASQQILQQRQFLEKKLHQAVIAPSIDNIKNYLYAQRALMNQSQRFAEYWQRTLLLYPELDETRFHPVNHTARQLYLASNEVRKTKKLEQLGKEYGLFFFFKGECPFCRVFAATLKQFVEQYGWSLLPISLDGQSLPEFSAFQHDNGLAAQFNINTVPSVIALHTKTKKVIPLSFKLISLAELEQVIDKMLGAVP